MSLLFTSRFNGPQSFPRKQYTNNGNIKNIPMAMPSKFEPSASNSMFSNARQVYSKIYDTRGEKRWQPITSSEITYNKKIKAIGKSSMHTQPELSFRSQDTMARKTALKLCRSGGCVAPKKKGAVS
jgi:hypothetical protein